MRYLGRAEWGIFLGIASYLTLAGQHGHLLRDPGVFWHIVVGERILATGQLPEVDTFSFTRAGERWIANQWLAEASMALLHRLGGFHALTAVEILILAGLYTWAGHRLIRAGFHWLLALGLVALTIEASKYHFHPRPSLATQVLLGGTFALLLDIESGRRPLRALGWLVPVFLLWTNLHAGMVGGFVTVGMAVAGWWVKYALGLEGPLKSWRDGLQAGILLIACGLTVLANPYGLGLFTAWSTMTQSPVIARWMVEHWPLDPYTPGGIGVILLAVVYVTALASACPRWPRVTWLIPLVWLVQGVLHIRHGPLFSLTAILALADLLPFARWLTWARKHMPGLHTPPDESPSLSGVPKQISTPIVPRALVPLAAFLVMNLALLYDPFRLPRLDRGSGILDPEYWPVDLLPDLKALEEQSHAGPPVRLFNDMIYGGFLIFHVPDLKVFIDDRCELYLAGPRDLLDEYGRAEAEDPARLEAWSREYHLDYALVKHGSRFERHVRDHPASWRRFRAGEAADLYQRVGRE